MSKRNLRLYLEDIIDSIEAIETYIKDLDVDEFKSDRKTYSATIREFEIIGEAVGKVINTDVVKKYKKIPWRDIKDFRNLLIHEYFGIDYEIVWNTIHEDLPQLKKTVIDILTSQKS
jgi:uncharacterized protein with HEPN domain